MKLKLYSISLCVAFVMATFSAKAELLDYDADVMVDGNIYGIEFDSKTTILLSWDKECTNKKVTVPESITVTGYVNPTYTVKYIRCKSDIIGVSHPIRLLTRRLANFSKNIPFWHCSRFANFLSSRQSSFTY